jgi:hypothetical protein
MESNIAYFKGIHRSGPVLIWGPVNPAFTLENVFLLHMCEEVIFKLFVLK